MRGWMFRDKSGKLSSIRLMSMIALVVAIFITIKGMFNGIYVTVNIVAADNFKFILSAWLVAAFAPKAIQKFAEKEFGVKNIKDKNKEDSDEIS